jgi:hypothetical protein
LLRFAKVHEQQPLLPAPLALHPFGECQPSQKLLNWHNDFNLDRGIIWYGGALPPEFDTYGTPNHLPTNYRTPNRYIQAEANQLFNQK